MRTYRQYCPIARASEILAERWTPLVLRNMLLGAVTFTEIADGAPGMSRTLLTTRLRELERAGVIETVSHGRGHHYQLTASGQDLAEVMSALGKWGERWIELAPEHLDPGMVLHSWVHWYLEKERLESRRVVVQFDFPGMPKKGSRLWVIFDGVRSEVCQTYPGFEVDLFVEAEPRALAEWHLGRIEWLEALRAERIAVVGPPALARSLPTWNRRSAAALARRSSLTSKR
ncbi:MAG TPA: helix-turn-helix domain-containing protein [Acidimicrobiia bacterium]|nr:helix-turn-helix domain-containing protein [Acidimicrobiia bacterium]